MARQASTEHQWNLETSFSTLIFSYLFHLVPDLSISTRVFEFWSFPPNNVPSMAGVRACTFLFGNGPGGLPMLGLQSVYIKA